MADREYTGDGGPWLLSQNRELREEDIFNWTLPAWAGTLPDGRTYNTCPEAGTCAKLCYARQGTYRFPAVQAAHQRNLLMVLDQPEAWEALMTRELRHERYRRRWVRVHDSGDFFSDAYLSAWLRIVRSAPATGFYCYTKAVDRFRRLVEPDPPVNFRWVYSLGGTEDHLVDREQDRHADVFPDAEAIEQAGYADQSASDLLAVLGPRKVGIPANNITHLRRRQEGRSFGALQQLADAARAERRARRGQADDRAPLPAGAAGRAVDGEHASGVGEPQPEREREQRAAGVGAVARGDAASHGVG